MFDIKLYCPNTLSALVEFKEKCNTRRLEESVIHKPPEQSGMDLRGLDNDEAEATIREDCKNEEIKDGCPYTATGFGLFII